MIPRVFPLWLPLRLAMILGGGVIALYGLAGIYTTAPALQQTESAPPGASVLAPAALLLIFTLPGLLLALHGWRSRLVISAEGVVYHSLFYRVASSWQNIERIGQTRRRRDAFFLRQSGFAGPRWLAPLVRGSGRDRVITISLHEPNWRNTPLRQEMQRLAPHLFASRPAARSQRRHRS